MARLNAPMLSSSTARLFTDDEMIRTGPGDQDRPPHGPHADRRRRRLASRARGTLPARRIFIHINNTNPILVDGSPERRRVEAAGMGGREDGMEIEL